MLPERLRASYNAADIADRVIQDLHESPTVFVESRGGEFPTDLLLRVLGVQLCRGAFNMTTPDFSQHFTVAFTSVDGLARVRVLNLDDQEEQDFCISDTPPPHANNDGDVYFFLDTPTS